MDQFGYIMISLGIFPLWLLIYTKAKRLRLRMRNVGIYGGIVALFTEPLFIQDYWEPPVLFRIKDFYFVEDFIYAFLYTGVAIAIYNFVFKIQYKTLYPKRKKASIIIALSTIISLLIFNILFGLNSLFVIASSLIMAAVSMIYLRKDLFIPALLSGIFMMLISILVYSLIFNTMFSDYWQHYWKLSDTIYGYYIFNTPWTEHLWHFSLGFFVSIVYDFASGTAKNIKLSSK